jgi:hypothetical protein
VQVPIAFHRRGGRKIVMIPEGSRGVPSPGPRANAAAIRALARAFRWRKLIETGTYATVAEIAVAETLNASYVSRVLRLTLLVPTTVETVLDGRQGPKVTLAALMRPFSAEWEKQRW